jgi:hypothetical protein
VSGARCITAKLIVKIPTVCAPPTDPDGMQISGGASLGYSVAVASKLQASVRQQGKDMIKLIDASTMGSTQLPAGVGENLNIKA